MLLKSKDGRFTIEQFQLKHVEQTADMIFRSFSQQNQLWKVFKPSVTNVITVLRLQILPCIRNSVSFVLLDNEGRVIGATIKEDLYDYQRRKTTISKNPVDEPLFQHYRKYRSELVETILERKCDRGTNLYGLYGAIDPDFKDAVLNILQSQTLSTWFWHACYFMEMMLGYQYFLCRVSHPESLKILQNLGASVLKEYSLQDQGLEDFKIQVIELDLVNKFKAHTPKL